MSGAKSGSFSTLLTANRSASVWPGHRLAQLVALRLRRGLSVDRGDQPLLVVDLLDRVLQLTVQDVPVRHDDHRVEDRRPVVPAQLDQVMRRPGNRRGLARAGSSMAR